MAEAIPPATWTDLRLALARIVGEKGCVFDRDEMAAYCEDWRRLHQGRTPAVVRPANTQEVASVVRLCAERHIGLVPQGGNTSLVDGATPSADGAEVVLSLSRMNKIRELDAVDLTMTIEAGATLQAAQEAALAVDCMLPLSMSSEGSAQVGGIISTNAGGNNTVRFGNTRNLVLGLEVVVPDGRIWNGLRRLHKDNTGYCLRQLFAGAEGTLGIITAAVLKLVSRPRDIALAFCAVPSAQAALDLFVLCRRHHYSAIQAFEYMCGPGVDLVLKHFPDTQLPLANPADHYVLVEFAEASPDSGLRQRIEEVLGKAMDDGLVEDAVLAGSTAQRAALWQLREHQADAHQREGAAVLNDIAVQVSKVPEFIRHTEAVLERDFPGVRVIQFGHVGDGNIHIALIQPIKAEAAVFLQQAPALMDAVNEIVRQFDGSFSAEHGVGRLKRHLMERWRGGAELETMRRIKRAVDPIGIMNPGKLFPPIE